MGTVTVFVNDPAVSGLRSSGSLRVRRTANQRALGGAEGIFVVCAGTTFAEVAGLAAAASRLHRLRGLFVREDMPPELLSPLLEQAGLRRLRNVFVHHGSEFPLRVMNAWRIGAAEKLIARATVVGDRLFVLTCSLELLRIPIRSLSALRQLQRGQLAEVEVARDGAYLHWPAADVHLDLEALRAAVDPSWRQRVEAERLRHDRRFGEAVASFRADRGLRQSDIATLSERHVRRIEDGLSMPRLETLRRLAKAHGLTLGDYLDEVARRVVRERPGVRAAS